MLEGESFLMVFAYDIVRDCVSKFHPTQPLPDKINEYIQQKSTSVSNGNRVVDIKVKTSLTNKVNDIKKAIFKYLDPKVNATTVVSKDSCLKDKGLLYTIRLAKFCRYDYIDQAIKNYHNIFIINLAGIGMFLG